MMKVSLVSPEPAGAGRVPVWPGPLRLLTDRFHLLLQSFFPNFIFIFFEVNLSSFLWFLASPGEARADIWFCSVHLSAPDRPLMQSDVEGNFDAAPRPSLRAATSDPGGGRVNKGLDLFQPSCLLNLRASVDGGEPGQHTCFFTPFLVFDPFILNHRTEGTCRAPPPPDHQHDLRGTAQTVLVEGDDANMQLWDTSVFD